MRSVVKSCWMCAAAVMTLVLAGCADDPQALTTSLYVSQADEALSRVREDAARHAPDLLADVEKQMQATKTSLALRRYREVERDMSKLGPDLERLIAVTKERRNTAEAELKRAAVQWNAIADQVPEQIVTLQQRVDAAKRSARPPAGMSAAKFAELQAEFENMKATWAQADQAVTDLKATEAATLGQQAKEQGDALLKQLK